MKRNLLPLSAAALSITVLFAGCGGSSKSSDTNAVASVAAVAPQEMPAAEAVDDSAGFYDAAPMAESYDMETSGNTLAHEPAAPGVQITAEQQAAAQRKIIRHASLTLETKAFDEALREIESLVTGSGGYVVSLQNALIVCVSAGPVLIVWLAILGLLACVIVVIIRRMQRRADQKRAAKKASSGSAPADQPPIINLPPEDHDQKS